MSAKPVVRMRFVPLLVVAALTLGIAGTAMATRSHGQGNGIGLRTGGPGAVGCAILDANGNSVTTVVASNIGDQSYWLKYLAGGDNAATVTFVVKPRFTGSPLASQKQVFHPGVETDVFTPFGIPFWGGDLTSGPWKLKVSNSLGHSASCNFTVVP